MDKDKNTTTCNHNNGTYFCALPEGHDGTHETVNYPGSIYSTRVTWTNQGGSTKFYRRKATR